MLREEWISRPQSPGGQNPTASAIYTDHMTKLVLNGRSFIACVVCINFGLLVLHSLAGRNSSG